MVNKAVELTIASLDDKGRGVAYRDGKHYVCEGVLPGERLCITETERRRNHLHVINYQLAESSPYRVVPPCPLFDECGGCQLQHLERHEQLRFKQARLQRHLADMGVAEPVNWLEPIIGDALRYRRRARLSVFQLPSGEVIIGFRRKSHTYIQDLQACPVLDPRLDALLKPLHPLLVNLSCANRVPQIELAAGDESVAMVLRHLTPLTDQDLASLKAFAEQHGVEVFSQAGGPGTLQAVSQDFAPELCYRLREQDVTLSFLPTDFIQANSVLNRLMVNAVIAALSPQSGDRILELFCGLGNFTLALARTAAQVLGVEGNLALVERARHNADFNGLSQASFQQADLYQNVAPSGIGLGGFNKLLLDPPREGAIEILKAMPFEAVARIVYVSCDAKTLARDLAYLVNKRGFHLQSIRMVDMLPQTMHLETISVLTNKEQQ